MLNLPTSATTNTFSRSSESVNLDADVLPPCEIGLPSRYDCWRPNQYEAVERILTSPKRFIAMCCATGFGKSMMVMAAAITSGERCAVLTMTKGLQDQYQEFADSLADIRGLANYTCPVALQLGVPAHTAVADAPCQCGYGCRLRRVGGCEYFDRYRSAQHADIFCTNYACWMYDGRKDPEQAGNLQLGTSAESGGDRETGILFCDEAHEIVDALGMFIGIDLTRRECLSLHLPWPDSGGTVADWRKWAGEVGESVRERIGGIELRLRSAGRSQWSRELKHLRDIERKLERLSMMSDADEWVLSESGANASANTMSAVRFDPLNPARYAEPALFRGIKKVVLVSATVRPKTAAMLGIGAGELEFIEYPSTFPPDRRPVIHVPSVRLNFRTEQDDALMREWLEVLDNVLAPRVAMGRKGIVHAVSYSRARFIVDNSTFSRYMITHTTSDRASVVEQFRRSEGPKVLVSPSVDTGYDFYGDSARFQCIVKIPFGSVTDPVTKARKRSDPDYDLYQVAQTLVQMTGRIVRAEEDFGETFILDQNLEWCLPKMRAKGFLPQWWMESFHSMERVPEPLV